jgi:hypothetical protein
VLERKIRERSTPLYALLSLTVIQLNACRNTPALEKKMVDLVSPLPSLPHEQRLRLIAPISTSQHPDHQVLEHS